MTISERSALLIELAAELRKNGSWAGETHVQKAAYILQELLGVLTGFEFVLYKHGPFSFDLREELSQMEAERLIRWKERPYPYGPTIIEGDAAPRLLQRLSDKINQYKNQIQFVATHLGDANVSELERIATALFVSLDPNVSGGSQVDCLVSLKPHIPRSEAPLAFEKLHAIRHAAIEAGLQPIAL